MTTETTSPAAGDMLELSVDKLAHGGKGIARYDGRVVFIDNTLPGDIVTVQLDRVKKNLMHATTLEVIEPSKHRGEHRCPAAAAGAGCCDFSTVRASDELVLKTGVAIDQLSRVGGFANDIPLTASSLQPDRGWRTRARLGVDDNGRAGMRRSHSRAVVTDVACNQLVDGLADGIIGSGSRRFTPGCEVVVVKDSHGNRHVIEVRTTGRGRRAETVSALLEGSGRVVEDVDGLTFDFPATAFWQAHSQAPQAYYQRVYSLLRAALETDSTPRHEGPLVGWDLYGGVGLFLPAINQALGGGAEVHSVDYSAVANDAPLEQPALAGLNVSMHNALVEKALPGLPHPDVVVLDPPRTGAGDSVISAVSKARPDAVVQIACDPATGARDLKSWAAAGYQIRSIEVIDAFPGTHHFEMITALTPARD